MRLSQLTVREIDLPLRAPFRTATGEVAHRRLLLVEVTDDGGRTGWAECVAGAVPGYTPETVDSAWVTITELLAPEVVGATATEPSELIAGLGRTAPDQPMARAAAEMALWALAAHQEGLPLALLLGGTRDRVATGIALGLHESPELTAEEAAQAADEGYRRIKLKIQPGADIDVVRAVRQRVGSTVMLSVDANGAYTRGDAGHLARLDAYGLAMIEQPLPPGDWDGLVQLRTQITTPICLDESIGTTSDIEEMVTRRAGQIVNLKPGRVGGLSEALAITERAVAHGLDVWCGGMLETGIGRAHNVALASLDAFTLPGDLSPSRRYWEEDIVDPRWIMDDGHLQVPLDRPGLGVEANVDLIDRLTTRRQEIRAV